MLVTSMERRDRT